MTDNPSSAATPAAPITLESALTAIRAIMDAQPEPAKTYLHNALGDVELAVRQDINAAIMAYAKRIPFVGGIVGQSVTAAIDQALDEGLIDLNGPATAA